MVGMASHADAILALRVARPTFVAARAREMKGHAPALWTQAQTVGQTLAHARELERIRAVEVHAEDLPDLIAHDLDEESFLTQEQCGRVKDRQSITRRDF